MYILNRGFCGFGYVSGFSYFATGPVTRFDYPTEYTLSVVQHDEKAIAHTGTFGVANTQSQR